MSYYTTEVRSLCESFGGYAEGVRGIDEQIDKARKTIFDFDYPVFSEEYRGYLEKKILKHYYFREIGAETFGMWQVQLSTKLNEIMPYYNQLYKSELVKLEPLINQKTGQTVKEDSKGTREYRGEKADNARERNTAQNTEKTRSNREDVGIENTKEKQNASTLNNDRGNSKSVSTPKVKEKVQNYNNGTTSTSGTTVNEQKVAGQNTHAFTEFNIESDTPQGGLGNITNTPLSDEHIGDPTGTNIYASRVAEHTHKDIESLNDGKREQITSNSESSVESGTTTTSRTGSDTVQNTENSTRKEERTADNERIGSRENRSSDTASRQAGSESTRSNVYTSYDTQKEKTAGDRLVNTIVKGLQGVSESQLLKEWRETFLNIDMQVIEDLQELFMSLYAPVYYPFFTYI